MMAAQNNFSDLINTLNAKADLLTRLKRWDEARRTAREAAKWAEEKQSTYGARNAYETIARASAALGDYKSAYEAQITSAVFNDSLNSEDQQELMAEMEAKYDAEKKDLLLQAKDSEIALQDTRIRLTNFTVGMLLLLAAVLAFNFIRIRKLNLRLSAQSEELEAKNEALASMGDFKDRLLTIVSHDVRNPLAGLKTVLAMQAAGEISAEEFDEWTRESAKRVDAALGMLGNLLEWSKTQLVGLKPYKEIFNADFFKNELHEQVQHQASLKKVRLRWEVENDLALHTDRHMLRTSMYNLISNAIKFSRKDDEVLIRMFRSRGGMTIEVHDQGVGMTPEVLERVRNPKDIYTTYGTENEKGTGIGLVLAYDMLALLGAGLSVDSKLGEGSTFTVFLPE
jgi:two-component system, sensor histidine kinase and response regulator